MGKILTLDKKRIESIKRMAENHGAIKVRLLKNYQDGTIDLLFITNCYNIAMRNKNNVYDQLYIDYK